jgi:hypothetical protein
MAAELQKKKLYHQIHPLKLAVDIGVRRLRSICVGHIDFFRPRWLHLSRL